MPIMEFFLSTGGVMRGLFPPKMGGGLLGGYLALFVGGLTQKRPVGALDISIIITVPGPPILLYM